MSHRAEARRARRRWCAVLLLVAALSGPTATAAAQQPQQPPSQEFDALLASGARSLDGGDLAAAEKALRRALRLRPGQPAATALLGNVVRRAGRLEEAEQLLRAAVHAAPAYYPARLWLGQTLLALARPEEAVEQLRTAAELAPREPAPRAFLAQALLRGDFRDGDTVLVDCDPTTSVLVFRSEERGERAGEAVEETVTADDERA